MESPFAGLEEQSGPSSAIIDLNIFDVNPLESNNERTKEVVEQQIFMLLDSCFWDLPNIPYDKISKGFEDINRFLALQAVSENHNLSEFIKQGLSQAVREYNWRESLYRSMLKSWNSLGLDIESSKPSEFHPQIEDLVKNFYSEFDKLLQLFNKGLLNCPLRLSLFPAVSVFGGFFKEILQELKNQTTRKKIQLKLCPGVEPPQIKRIQRQYFKIIKKPYIEWNAYCKQEVIEIEHEPSCIMVPLLHRLMNYTSQVKTHVLSYFAPTDWEVTRISAHIVEGNYKTAIIKRTACKQNKGLAEVEITYPRITRDHIWCKVQLEGVMSKKSVQEIKIPEFKTIIVTVDEDGEHELPPEFLQEID
ncbi:hypothetical protein SteCoe_30042 [Stentor coeruleus]|uniref:Uncharacterized protein n=1 Tax=Stentor coeruleus TaxID=5963 RepID=A0A1R2B4G1_9CILI|nr:hypothetical protein SteCoe_30042 [Stentor coeruleus]